MWLQASQEDRQEHLSYKTNLSKLLLLLWSAIKSKNRDVHCCICIKCCWSQYVLKRKMMINGALMPPHPKKNYHSMTIFQVYVSGSID